MVKNELPKVVPSTQGVFRSKEEHDTHIYVMIKNLVHDQAAYNINHREAYYSLRETHSYLKEEAEETVEALDEALVAEHELWKMIKDDENEEMMIQKLKHIQSCAVQTIIEALHMAAVANKAITQFESKRQ